MFCRPSLASVGGEGGLSHFRFAFPLLGRLDRLCQLAMVTLGWPSLCSDGIPWPLLVEGGGVSYAMRLLSAYQNHFKLAFLLLCRLDRFCRLTEVTLG